MDDDSRLDSTLMEAYTQAPPYIQQYLQSGKFDAFMGMLTNHFGLHADVAGRAENEILMTIIGMTSPNELETNLKNAAGVAPGLVAPILEELNQEVFIPLRDSLRTAPQETPTATPAPVIAPAAEARQWVDVTPTTPAPAVATPAPAPVVPTYTPPTIQPDVVVPPPVAQPIPTVPVQPAPAPTTVAAPEYHELHSMMRTMSKDIEALKNGTQPAMQPWKPISVPAEPIQAPVAPAPSTPIMQSAPIPEVKTVATPIVHERISTPVQSGGGDPYREPVE